MNTHFTQVVRPGQGRSQHGFTMIEIAIALGVIGFALVAIIGVLPIGMNAQKNNREDTIINQDSAYFMEAIRGGVQGLDELTNHIDFIAVTNFSFNTSTRQWETNSWTVHSYNPGLADVLHYDYHMTNGFRVMTNLTTIRSRASDTNHYTDVYVYVRALSGSALEQDGNNQLVSFRYLLRPEIRQFSSFPLDTNSPYWDAVSDGDPVERATRQAQAKLLAKNLFDVRLRFNWPVKPNGNYGGGAAGGSQTYRASISARTPSGSEVFNSQTYTNK